VSGRLPNPRINKLIGNMVMKNTAPKATGLTIACNNTPKRVHKRFNADNRGGAKIADAKKAVATTNAHRRKGAAENSGITPTIMKNVAITSPKARSVELLGGAECS
jgi:hypothetical protein